MRAFVSLIVVLGACATELPGEAGEEAVNEVQQALGSGTRIIHNFHGDTRYVRVNSHEVKLFLDADAEAANNPKDGFRNTNHFENSCGPTAAMNAFLWYGIIALEGQWCRWFQEPELPDLPPIWRCTDRVNASSLGLAMQTNRWRMATFEMPGTSTSNFREVYKPYLERYMGSNDVYQYRYDEGSAQVQYNNLWATLAQGHPIVVTYKTGPTRGHFALIVGIEKAGDPLSISDDRIIMANPRKEDLDEAISFTTFRRLWMRDYSDFGALALVGERRYSRINLWDSTQSLPPPPGGGGGGGGGGNDGPPRHEN